MAASVSTMNDKSPVLILQIVIVDDRFFILSHRARNDFKEGICKDILKEIKREKTISVVWDLL